MRLTIVHVPNSDSRNLVDLICSLEYNSNSIVDSLSSLVYSSYARNFQFLIKILLFIKKQKNLLKKKYIFLIYFYDVEPLSKANP
jgi:hypothetical protein